MNMFSGPFYNPTITNMKSILISAAKFGILAGSVLTPFLHAQSLIPGDENWFVFPSGLEGEASLFRR